MKMYSMHLAPLILGMFDQLIHVFKASDNENQPLKRLQRLYRYITITEYIFKISCTLFTVTVVGYLISPVAIYLLTHERKTIIPIALPFVDDKTLIGFIIMSTFEGISAILGALGTAGSDLTFAMIIINTHAVANIIDESIDDLNNDLQAKRPKILSIKGRFRNVLLQNLEIVE